MKKFAILTALVVAFTAILSAGPLGVTPGNALTPSQTGDMTAPNSNITTGGGQPITTHTGGSVASVGNGGDNAFPAGSYGADNGHMTDDDGHNNGADEISGTADDEKVAQFSNAAAKIPGTTDAQGNYKLRRTFLWFYYYVIDEKYVLYKICWKTVIYQFTKANGNVVELSYTSGCDEGNAPRDGSPGSIGPTETFTDNGGLYVPFAMGQPLNWG